MVPIYSTVVSYTTSVDTISISVTVFETFDVYCVILMTLNLATLMELVICAIQTTFCIRSETLLSTMY